MRSALRRLEAIHAATAGPHTGRTAGGADDETTAAAAAELALQEREKKQRLAQLTPYRQAEFQALECIQGLRTALRECNGAEAELRLIEGRAESNSSDNDRGTGGGLEGPTTAAAAVAAGTSGITSSKNASGHSEGTTAAAAALPAQLLRRVALKLKASDMNRRALLQQQLARSRQAARRTHMRLQKLQKDAERLSRAPPKSGGIDNSANSSAVGAQVADCALLNDHIEKAKRFYREEFRIVVVSTDDPLLSIANGGGLSVADHDDRDAVGGSSSSNAVSSGARKSDRKMQGLFTSIPNPGKRAISREERPTNQRTGVGACNDDDENNGNTNSREHQQQQQSLQLQNAREDAEFATFFATVQQKDALMDEAFDRIASAVHRIRDNATGIQDELFMQEALLSQTDERVARNDEALRHMNRRLVHAIRELDESSVCSYVLCLLMLLLVLGVLVKVADL